LAITPALDVDPLVDR